MSPQYPADEIRSHVRSHYSEIARESGCCGPSQASCCAPAQPLLLYDLAEAQDLPAEIANMSLGCGDPVSLAQLEEGQVVLDLGSGGGIDCFLAARRVGPQGFVIGVDMTLPMLERARSNQTRLGVKNVEFRLGEIEHLPVADASIDVIISNCVINLSPDKPQVFREAYRVLKPGGRLAISDIVTDGPLPASILANPNAWSGCLAGALDVKDYLAAIQAAGFIDAKVESAIPVEGFPDLPRDEQGDRSSSSDSTEAAALPKIFSARITARKPV